MQEIFPAELVHTSNDAFRPNLGEQWRHPTALGQRAPECCAERWGTGTVISADVLSQIFDPFFITKEVGQGAGFGKPYAEEALLEVISMAHTGSP